MLKTNKSFAKRIKVSGGKKLLHRWPGQNHFNAKKTGKIERRRKNIAQISQSDKKLVKRFLPYL